MVKNKPLIFEGHDRCGKTTIANALAEKLGTEVFMTNSRQCFTSKSKPESMQNLAKFNYMIADYIRSIKTDKPVIVYRSFLSEMVYSELFDRPTSLTHNHLTDAAFNQMGAIVVLCKNEQQEQFMDNETSDEHIRKSIELFDKHKKQIRCRVVEIDTSKQNVSQYVELLYNLLKEE